MAENKVNLLTEGFSVENAKKGTEGVKISGFALPFDTTSRNGFSYRKESIMKTYKTLEGKPMFFNHDIESLPLGRVESVSVDEKGMHYTAELMPTTDHEKAIVEKVKNGLLNKVSIQCMYSNAKVNEKTGDFAVDVSEFLELSMVGVPGFADTTAQAHEMLSKEKRIKVAHKKLKEELEKPEDEQSTEQEGDDTPVTKAELEELMSRISVLESRLDAQDEESTEGEDSEDDEKSKEAEGDEEEKPTEEGDGSEEPDGDEEKKEESFKRQTSAPQTKTNSEYNASEIRYARMMKLK